MMTQEKKLYKDYIGFIPKEVHIPKEDILEGIKYLEDITKEERNKAYAYQYMINLLDNFVKDEYDLGWEDTVYAYIYIA